VTVPASPVAADALEVDIVRTAQELRLEARSVELDSTPAFPRAEFELLSAQGWVGLRAPTSLGGRGLSLRRSGRLLWALARESGTTFAKLSLQPEFCSVLADHGSAELVERWYRPLVQGLVLVGNQITEPSAGSDAGALATQAVRDGDGYLLTGSKSEAAFAVDADAAVVYARVVGPGSPEGVSAFLVPQDLPGIERSTIPDLGERWMRRGTVEYRSVRVPASHRLGEEGQAFGYLKAELDRERAALAAIYLGVARRSWEQTVEHVGTRTAFGRPLASQEAVSFPLAEDWARLDAAELYVDRVLAGLDDGSAGSASAALAKWLASTVALEVLDHAIQFHGGRGYSKALPHEQRWRDVRSGAIAHGPSEIMRLVGARGLWPR
jgi:cyclohexanecarboxyl-CoA dehydrogenase